MLMIYVLYTLAILFFLTGIAGTVYTEWPKRVHNLSFLYFAFSLPAHLLAGSYFILSGVILLLALTVYTPGVWLAVISAVTMLLFTINLWRSYQGHKVFDAILPGDNHSGMGAFIKSALLPLSMRRKGVRRIADIAYGDGGRKNTLDVYVPETESTEPRPVLFHVHGGAWVYGRKKTQAQPLINYLVSRGWVAVDINYRLGPTFKMQDIVEDVLRAMAWTKTHIGGYGGDPEFVAATGGSAGGHLSSLISLMPNNPAFKPGFEDIDCSVAASVPLYGVYDFLDRTGQLALGQEELEAFLTRHVMPGSPDTHREFWEQVCPISHVSEETPPIFVIHGRHDALAAFKGAEIFVDALRETSKNDVVFAALPSGQHAFDCGASPPTPAHIRAVERFLNKVRAEKKSS